MSYKELGQGSEKDEKVCGPEPSFPKVQGRRQGLIKVDSSNLEKCHKPLALPDGFKIYPTFHVSFLKPYYEEAGSSRAQQRPTPSVIKVKFEKTVENILDHRMFGESNLNRRTDFLVQWKGESELKATWKRGETLWQFENLV
ncbi:hypothetical protein LWI29_006931 [Acer saccharum]|uniref:Chromo domain-containing protein n=1 Tax=Acer saccharum TaxID=4024 RepID=A0AA39SBP1_ACESA|nr:hypothetical protein LWI29_006931 [Acer saccharum]